MDYFTTVNYLENLQYGRIKTDMNNVIEAFNELGNPQKNFTSIHIAGTNGKGSIAVMMESVLREAGYSTGLYTSPHIKEFTERIKVSDVKIPKNTLINCVKKHKNLFKKYNCTYFEAATIICFLYFRDKNIDIAVVETGMGGRWDATNVLNPILSVISDLSIEHQKYLGGTIKDIAKEKGGIIKTEVDCIVSSRKKNVVKILKNIADRLNSNYFDVYSNAKIKLKNIDLNGLTFDYCQNGFSLRELFIPLTGLHQIRNAKTAIFALNRLKNMGFTIKSEHITDGLKKLKLEGRFDVINKKPIVISDVGHNPDAFYNIKDTIRKIFPSNKVFLLFGVKSDKDYVSIINAIKPVCREIVGVKLNNYNSLEPNRLVDITKKLKIKYSCFNSTKEGLEYLLKKSKGNDIILAAGSHQTVNEIKKEF